MQRILLIQFLLFFSFCINANEIKINQMVLMDNFHAKFHLKSTKKDSPSIVLDCQSFINKLDFYDKNQMKTSDNIIGNDECETMYNHVNRCLDSKGIKCFDPMNINIDSCGC